MGRILLASVVLLIGGCDCGSGLRNVHGELTASVEGSPEVRAPGTLEVDFGSIMLGDSSSRVVSLRNLGRGSLTVRPLVVIEGEVSMTEGGTGPFRLMGVEAGSGLAGGGSGELTVSFHPTSDDINRDHEFFARVRLEVEGARPGEEWLELVLTGNGLAEACSLPQEIDFGHVWPGETREESLVLHNEGQSTRTGFVSKVDSDPYGVFALQTAEGDVELAPGAGHHARLTFTPAAVRVYEARIWARRSKQCQLRTLRLVGRGIDRAVVWKPSPLDCGHVPVGLSRVMPLTFINLGHADAIVSGFPVSGPSFALAEAPASLSLPARGGEGQVVVRCTPPARGAFTGQLHFATSLPGQPSDFVPLQVWGGGPDIQVEPTHLELGEVAFVPGASPPVIQRREVVISNVGDPVRDASGHLRVGSKREDGSYGPPWFTFRALNADTRADEFSAALPAWYRDEEGLAPPGGRSAMPVTIRLAPASAGLKEAELLIHSNDLDEPDVRVTLRADAVVLPECRYSVSAATLDFGVVSAPGHKLLSFTVRNDGSAANDVCILSAVALTPATQAVFELVGSPISRHLGPGEHQRIDVRFRAGATPSVEHLGEVELYMSSKATPRTTVSLRARTDLECLTLIPTEVDFGEAEVGCASLAQTVLAYNGCDFPIELSGYGIADPAPTSPGTGTCSGATPCPSYRFAGGPLVADGGIEMPVGGDPLELQVVFSPKQLGERTGSARFDVRQGDAGVSYALPLRGTGAQTGEREDVFHQSPDPKLDLVISTTQYQNVAANQVTYWTHLMEGMEALVDDLQQKGIDFHLGVTVMNTTAAPHVTWPGVFGKFLPDDGTPPVLSPASPNLKHTILGYFEPVNGNAGSCSCFQSIHAATTPPVSEAQNAGFLRKGVGLVGLCWNAVPDCSGPPHTGIQNVYPVMTGYHLLQSIKGADEPAVRLVGITEEVGGAVPCTLSQSLNHQRIPQMVALTGGAIANACEEWYPRISETLGAAAGYRTQFPLSASPAGGAPPQVLVNGGLVTATGMAGEVVWSYDSSRNVVTFLPGQVPPPGSEVRLRYVQACH